LLKILFKVLVKESHNYAVTACGSRAGILGDIIVSKAEPGLVIEETVQAVELTPFVLFSPGTKLSLHFTDIHRNFILVSIRLPLLGRFQQTAALRQRSIVADAWPHPCFACSWLSQPRTTIAAPTLATGIGGLLALASRCKPPTFTMMNFTR
jgi:hypothetical protein